MSRRRTLLAMLLCATTGAGAAATPAPPGFDGAAALAEIERQVEYGPRISGEPGHRRTLEHLAGALEAAGARVERQPLRLSNSGYGDMHGVNLIAHLGPEQDQPAWALATHWDTRPHADHDPDPQRRQDPVPGANDGASGTAVLLQLARALADHPPAQRVDLLFFDLEDRGRVVDGRQEIPYSLGAEMFMRAHPDYRPRATLVVDMVCDAGLRLPRTALVRRYAPDLQDYIWGVARELGLTALVDADGVPIMDDHVPFLRRRLPAALLIHAPFPDSWHTTDDLPGHCSAASLSQVGRLLLALVAEPPPATKVVMPDE